MIIYKGYYYFKKGNGIITKINTYNNYDHGEIGKIGEQFYIKIEKEDPLEEQVKTVLHELAHLGLEGKNFDKFDPYFTDNMMLGKLSNEQKNRMIELENEIDKDVENFYERNSPLVDHIRKKLSDYNYGSFNL